MEPSSPLTPWLVLMTSQEGLPSLDRATEEELRRALKVRKGRATLGDLVRDTGLPKTKTETALRTMLGLYRSHLAVDENGELLYLFHPSMERRIKPNTNWERIFAWCRKTFVVGFKFSIMLLLLAYVLTFCVLIVAALIAVIAIGEDFLDLDVGEDVGCLSFFADMFTFWNVGDVAFIPIYMADSAGSTKRYNHATSGPPLTLRAPRALDAQYVLDTYRIQQTRKPHFWDEVFGFVFGPQLPEPPTLAQEREILDFIENNNGVLTLTELVSRSGMTAAQANEELSRLLVRYDGDIKVTEGGELLYTFHDLRVTAGEDGRAQTPAPPTWHRFESNQRLTGNSGGKDFLIGSMAAFTMAMSIITPLLLMPILNIGTIAIIPLAIIPFIMSLLFFLIPLGRSVKVSAENKSRKHRNTRRAVLLAIFRHLAEPENAPWQYADLQHDTSEILAKLRNDSDDPSQINSTMTSITDKEISATIQEMLTELDAERDVDDQGNVVLTFPTQRAELKAADAARIEAQHRNVALGDIVYSSANEDDDPLDDAIEALEPSDTYQAEPDTAEHEEDVVAVEESVLKDN